MEANSLFKNLNNNNSINKNNDLLQQSTLFTLNNKTLENK
jgi:hypothetical protein